MGSEYGPATFGDEFYQQRLGLKNTDERDNSRRETTNGNYLLKMIERTVTLGSAQGMGERDIHAMAMRGHAKQVDHLGPKATAGREEAVHPVLLNSTTNRSEPLVLAHMNDRLACHQEVTVGLVTRDKNEIELIYLLKARGLAQEDRYTDEDDLV